MKNCLAVGIILLFVGSCIIPAIAQNIEKSHPTTRGNWLFVGGSGPGNYSRIQDAIDDASDGDTVFVYSGIYYERIIIPKSITLRGESKNTTVIDAITSDEGFLVALKRDNISISGFTLRFNGDWGHPRVIISNFVYPYEGINNITISDNILLADVAFPSIWLSQSHFCSITQNTFFLQNYSRGIELHWCKNCSITNNFINTEEMYDGGAGIELLYTCNSTILNNSIISNGLGCGLTDSKFNTISHNYFHRNYIAIQMHTSDSNRIISNHIENQLFDISRGIAPIGIRVKDTSSRNGIEKNFISHYMFGIFIEESYRNVISQNTFIKNIFHARFSDTGFSSGNIWNQNYWGRPRILPKPIFGIKNIEYMFPGFIEFDWHPAREPYDIPGMI
jgi:parallel beta-helix repeat protein